MLARPMLLAAEERQGPGQLVGRLDTFEDAPRLLVVHCSSVDATV